MPETPSKSSTTPTGRPVRLQDIADLAGVHVTAVSAVLRGSSHAQTRTRVSDETATRIRALAEQLHYRPHRGARTMRIGRTRLIGLLEFGYSEASQRRTSDLAVELKRRGFEVMSHNALWYPSLRDAVNVFLDARVEGIIMIQSSARLEPVLVDIRRAKVPCVAFNGDYLPGLPQVRTDVFAGVRELTSHLINQGGRRRLALLTSIIKGHEASERYWLAHERIEGFSSVVNEAGGAVVKEGLAFPEVTAGAPSGVIIVENPWEGSTHADLGYRAAKRLLATGLQADALICASDRFAFGAMRACFEAGIRIPEPMAVVGFNNEADTRYYSPSLTTIDTLYSEAAAVAVDLLFAIMDGKASHDAPLVRKVPGRLVVRESCGQSARPKTSI